jgi:hypothetical protein
MKRLLTLLLIGVFITSLVYASDTTFTDHSGIGDHTVTVGDSNSSTEPNMLEVYGGGADAWDAVGEDQDEHPGAIKLWTGGDTPVAVYLWVRPDRINSNRYILMISSGSSASGYGIPGEVNFDIEASGTIVGHDTNTNNLY